jgi:hypothetical protein
MFLCNTHYCPLELCHTREDHERFKNMGTTQTFQSPENTTWVFPGALLYFPSKWRARIISALARNATSWTRCSQQLFSIYLILPVALSPGVYSASNRNEYQKHKNNVTWE